MKYRKIDKYKYQLACDVERMTEIKGISIITPFIRLYKDGRLRIKKGYAWNGSNWSLDKNSLTASLFHDVGYQLMRLELLSLDWRQYFDGLYRNICIEKGVWVWHANLRYTMLRNFGLGGAKPTGKPEHQILEE